MGFHKGSDDRFKDPHYQDWAVAVKSRDDYTCIVCNQRGVELNSHHMNSWDAHPADRFDIDNGATLCKNCHESFHKIYGLGKNTKYQFKEFQKIAKLIIKNAGLKISNI
jgi:5-methylcytosine-specific restriction endonuclease McrA